MSEMIAQCSCGKVSYKITGPAATRILCHCTFCQTFNDAAYSDIVLYNAKRVEYDDNNPVEFTTYSKPPAVQRGKCKHCGDAAIEFFNIPLGPKMVMVPAAMLDSPTVEPAFHMYYHRRINDVHDELPKYSGKLKNQYASLRLLKAVLGK